MGAHLWIMESIMKITKEIPHFVILIASIVFNDLSGMENYIY